MSRCASFATKVDEGVYIGPPPDVSMRSELVQCGVRSLLCVASAPLAQEYSDGRFTTRMVRLPTGSVEFCAFDEVCRFADDAGDGNTGLYIHGDDDAAVFLSVAAVLVVRGYTVDESVSAMRGAWPGVLGDSTKHAIALDVLRKWVAARFAVVDGTPVARTTEVNRPLEVDVDASYLVVPPGIGDIMWIYQRIETLRDVLECDVWLSPVKDPTPRAEGFVRCLPNVRWGGYHPMTCGQLLERSPHRYKTPEALRGGPHAMQLNRHLEDGNPLAAWMPELPCNYHPKLNDASIPAQKQANAILRGQLRPYVGIYCSTWQCVQAWRGFTPKDWIALAKRINESARGKCTFVLIGADFDYPMTEPLASQLEREGMSVARCIGEVFETAVEVMRRLDVMLAFPSGVPITAISLGIPTVWWLPSHLDKLAAACLDPADVASGAVVTHQFNETARDVLDDEPVKRALAKARIIRARAVEAEA